MKNFTYTAIAISISCLFFSCIKEKEFPVVPVITFKEYIKYGLDSADCIITFQDGDGDIGRSENSPNDIKMKYLYKDTITGLFLPFDSKYSTPEMDTLFYTHNIPLLTPDGQYKALDGEIKIRLNAIPLYWPEHEVVKFEISLSDRAGHISNRVTTNEIILK